MKNKKLNKIIEKFLEMLKSYRKELQRIIVDENEDQDDVFEFMNIIDHAKEILTEIEEKN